MDMIHACETYFQHDRLAFSFALYYECQPAHNYAIIRERGRSLDYLSGRSVLSFWTISFGSLGRLRIHDAGLTWVCSSQSCIFHRCVNYTSSTMQYVLMLNIIAAVQLAVAWLLQSALKPLKHFSVLDVINSETKLLHLGHQMIWICWGAGRWQSDSPGVKLTSAPHFFGVPLVRCVAVSPPLLFPFVSATAMVLMGSLQDWRSDFWWKLPLCPGPTLHLFTSDDNVRDVLDPGVAPPNPHLQPSPIACNGLIAD